MKPRKLGKERVMVSKAARRKQAKSNSKSSTSRGPLLVVGTLLILGGWVAWNAFIGTNSQEIVQRSGNTGSAVGDFAPDFTVPTLDGQEYNLASQQGKPTILFAMAYWCGTCIPEANALAQLHDQYGDNLSILVLDVDPSSSPELLSQFKSTVGNPDFVWAFDAGQVVTRSYQISALDTTLVLDAEGVVIYRDAYPTSYTVLENLLRELLPSIAG